MRTLSVLLLTMLVVGCQEKQPPPAPLMNPLTRNDPARLRMFMPQTQAEALFDTPALDRKTLVFDHPELGEVREELVQYEIRDGFWWRWSMILSFQRDSLRGGSLRRQFLGIRPSYARAHMEERIAWRLEAARRVHGTVGRLLSEE